MFAHTNRIVFTMLALVGGLYASGCAKTEGEVQTAATASTTSPGNPPGHAMGPGPMGPGMEGHQKHDGGHDGGHR